LEVAMPTSVWKGRITFGLVSIPIRLFPAIQSHDIHFHLLHEKDMSRVGIEYYCKKDEEVVSRSELIKGYEHKKGEFIVVEPEELEAIEPQSSSNLDIQQFVDMADVDPIYYDSSYYAAAEEGTEKTYALLLHAMQKKNRAAIGKLFMRDREYLTLIRPSDHGLILETMYFADEIRSAPKKVPKEQKGRNKETELAELLVENLTEAFDPQRFKDEYMDRVEALIEAKAKGQKVKAFRTKPVKTVPNVLEALQKSLKQVQKKKTA
jgi:DNA end-binding protein Ku